MGFREPPSNPCRGFKFLKAALRRSRTARAKGTTVWLSIIAYMIQFGTKLGLVKTEPESAVSRAYVRAHDALHWLRTHLVGSTLESVRPDSVCF